MGGQEHELMSAELEHMLPVKHANEVHMRLVGACQALLSCTTSMKQPEHT